MLCSRPAAVAGVLAVLLAPAPPATADEPEPRRGEVVVVAGTGVEGSSGDGWAADNATIGAEVTVTVAPDNTVYLSHHQRVRVVTPDGVISTLPDVGPRFADRGPWHRHPPTATAIAPDGTLYLATSEGVGRRAPDGTFTLIAEVDRESGREAGLGYPDDLAVDAAGSVYVADSHFGRVHRIDPDGTITTIAGGGQHPAGAGDGAQATELWLSNPGTVAVDSAGNVYVATHFKEDETRPVGRIAPDGTYTNVSGTTSGIGPIGGIAVDDQDNLYLTDIDNQQIRMVDPAGTVTVVAPVDGGYDIAVGPDGDLYTAGHAVVHRLVRHGDPGEEPPAAESRWADRAPGTVETVLGTGREPAGEYPSASQFVYLGPSRLAAGPDGTIHYADPGRLLVGTLATDGTHTEIPLREELSDLAGLAVGPDGTVHVASTDGFRQLDPAGVVTEADRAGLRYPEDVAFDAAGVRYVADDEVIRRRGPDGSWTTIAGGGRSRDEWEGTPAVAALIRPIEMTVDGAGTVYFLDSSDWTVWRVGSDGVLRVAARGAELNGPRGLATGPDGSVYIADAEDNRVRRVTPDGVVTTVAGTGERVENGDGGPATEAAVLEPTGVTVTGDGTVYVASPLAGSIRRIDPSGTITTFTRFSGQNDGRPATDVDIVEPEGITVDRAGTVFVGSDDDREYVVGRDGRVDQVDNAKAIPVGSGPDGSIYQHEHSVIERRHPSGAVVRVGDISDRTDVALGPDGALYVASWSDVYRIDESGVLESIAVRPAELIAVGPDGSVYVDAGDRVVKLAGDKVTVVAEVGPSGLADLAVAGDGTVYAATRGDIRRIATDGTVETVLSGSEVGQLALDVHGDLYFTEPARNRVRVLVAPGDIVFDRFDTGTMWLGVNAAVAAFAFVIVRRRLGTDRGPRTP